MSAVTWWVLALLAGLATTVLGAGALVRRRGRDGALEEPLPTTPLQRLSRVGLGAGGVLAAVLVGVVLCFGPQRTFADDRVRIVFTLVVLSILAVFAGLSLRILSWMRGGGAHLDERDRTILAGASAVSSGAVLITLAISLVGLQESFWEAGAVPLAYLNLVFWSCLLVSLLALPLGILMGYRRA